MKQVPKYLLIGNGRVARHMAQYFHLLKFPFMTWQRNQSQTDLHELLQQATHVLLLINDNAIQDFADKNLQTHNGVHIHFSGSLVSANVYGAHPLQTFNNAYYTLEEYQSIPFILDDNAPELADLLPGLNNSYARLNPENKTRYHALCVLSGNFSCLLWQKLFNDLEGKLNIPKQMAFEYLRQQTQNLITDSANALTGPLVRNDRETIDKHLAVLSNDEFKEIYESFVNCYDKLKAKELL
jgi:hypothetical protein